MTIAQTSVNKTNVDKTMGVCKISGDLNFERANEVFRSINFSTIENDQVTVDFSAVEHSDSAALAVMLEWMNQAKRSQKQINFTHIPVQLMRLIKMTDLQNILKLA